MAAGAGWPTPQANTRCGVGRPGMPTEQGTFYSVREAKQGLSYPHVVGWLGWVGVGVGVVVCSDSDSEVRPGPRHRQRRPTCSMDFVVPVL